MKESYRHFQRLSSLGTVADASLTENEENKRQVSFKNQENVAPAPKKVDHSFFGTSSNRKTEK
jgi:hypothetical protein